MRPTSALTAITAAIAVVALTLGAAGHFLRPAPITPSTTGTALYSTRLIACADGAGISSKKLFTSSPAIPAAVVIQNYFPPVFLFQTPICPIARLSHQNKRKYSLLLLFASVPVLFEHIISANAP